MKTNPQLMLAFGLTCGLLVSFFVGVLIAHFHGVKEVPGFALDAAVLFMGIAGGFSLTMLLFIVYIVLTP